MACSKLQHDLCERLGFKYNARGLCPYFCLYFLKRVLKRPSDRLELVPITQNDLMKPFGSSDTLCSMCRMYETILPSTVSVSGGGYIVIPYRLNQAHISTTPYGMSLKSGDFILSSAASSCTPVFSLAERPSQEYVFGNEKSVSRQLGGYLTL